MNDNSDLLPNLLHEEFEMQMRGYSRRQVDDFVARRNGEIRDLEQRLARTMDEAEHLRREVATVRQQALAGRPAHEEVSERIAQILKLADDEAKAQKGKAGDEISKLRAEAQQESERVRGDAQEQAERTISAARNEADKTRTAARTEADRLTSETRKKADAALASAKAQAKKVLDEATARATAIHDGAERRLNLLSTRHAETVRRLTDILDGVQGLVAAEAAGMSLEEEVNQQVAKAIALAEAQEQEQAAAAAAREDVPAAPRPADRPVDLGSLAPPAPETIATGTPAPAGSGTDSRSHAMAPQPGRQPAGRPGPGLPDSAPLGSQVVLPTAPPGLGNARPGTGADDGSGRPLPSGALPSGALPSGPSRSSSARSGGPLSGNPLATGTPQRPGTLPPGPGRGDPPDRDRDRDSLREPARSTGTIDPDEPTEGIRMMP